MAESVVEHNQQSSGSFNSGKLKMLVGRIPEAILIQLGLQVQHALRTPLTTLSDPMYWRLPLKALQYL